MIPFKDVPSAGEAAAIDSMVQAVLDKQRKERVAGTVARRDVHAKSLGLVRGKFRVRDSLPESLRVGLFAQPAEYDAVLRFSNGAFGPAGFDILPNIRGMALKLFNVPGAKLLPGEENSTEHDFLMANDRSFFCAEIEQMLLLTQGKMGALLRRSPGIAWNMMGAMLKLVKNPLTIDYFSQVPYRFGAHACKFALLPGQKSPFLSLPNALDRDYLRHAVESTLRGGEVKLCFAAQFQREGESIADSSRVWHGSFVPLAELTLSSIDSPILESDGEALSFNPWRALAEHEPLSWVGRARRAVYFADFAWRTQENNRPQV